MSSTDYSRQILKVVVAQLAKTIGFSSAQPITLDILTEILECYILLITKSCRESAELASRTDPTFEDVAAALDRNKVNLSELEDFVTNVEIPNFIRDTITFPNPKENKLGFVDDPNNEEIQERINNEDMEHIYEYFPLMTRVEEPVAPQQLANSSTAEAQAQANQDQGDDLIQQETSVTINGVTYEKSKWTSQYESMKGLRRAMGDLDIAASKQQHREPKEPIAKFPPNFHKPKSKLKKFALSKIQANEYEDQNESAELDVAAKVNIPTNVDLSQINQQQPDNMIDDMIDAVVTKYSAQTSKLGQRSPSPQRLTGGLSSMFEEAKLKIKKTSIPERLILDSTNPDETFSPIKVTDDDDTSPMKQQQQQQQQSSTPSIMGGSQLKLKIPRSSIEKPTKVKKQEKKGLKLIIDKKRVINSSSVEPSSNERATNETRQQTIEEIINIDSGKKTAKLGESNAVISFDTDDEDYEKDNKEENIQSLLDKEPLIWRPSCNVKSSGMKSSGLFDDLTNSAASSPLLKSNFGTFSFTTNDTNNQNKGEQQLVATVGSGQQKGGKAVEVLSQSSMFTPIKLTDLIDESANTTTAEQVTTIDTSLIANQQEVVEGGESSEKHHHKKHKKDKDHKKHHKKDKHEKHEKKKHKSKEHAAASVDGDGVKTEKQEETNKAPTPPLPKIKLKLGGEVIKPKAENTESSIIKKEDNETTTTPSIPKLLLKPMSKQSQQQPPKDSSSAISTPTPLTSKTPGSLKIKFKLDKSETSEMTTTTAAAYLPEQQQQQETDVDVYATEDESVMDTSSAAVDVVNIDESFEIQENNKANNANNESLKKDLIKEKGDILLKLQSLESSSKKSGGSSSKPDKTHHHHHHKKHKKHKREQIEIDLHREPGYENYITQEQLLNITESISSGQLFQNRDGSGGNNLMNTINSVASTGSEKKKEKKKDRDRDRDRLSLDNIFKAEIGTAVGGEVAKIKFDKSSKSDKKLKIKNEYSPPPVVSAALSTPTFSTTSKKTSGGSSSKSKDGKKMSIEGASSMITKFEVQSSISAPVVNASNSGSLQTTPSKIIDDTIPLDKLLTTISASSSQKQSTITGTTEIYEEVWICPSCKNNDDGTPMIGCDSCDDWYHWSCVGITQEPPENSQWYCNKCNFNDSAKRIKKKKKS